MYGVLGVLLVVMGVSSALDDRLPWSRRVGRYKIELLPIEKEEFEMDSVHKVYPLPIGESDPWRQSYRTNVGGQEFETLHQETNVLLIQSSTARYENCDGEKQSMRTSSKPPIPGTLRRYVRTYGAWKALSSPVKSFINETIVKLQRRKRKKKRRKNALFVPDSNLKINVSISEPKIIDSNVKSAYVKAHKSRTSGFVCTCGSLTEETTKTRFILTPCECEGEDYEITEPSEINEVCEEKPEEEADQEEMMCDECGSEEPENTECEYTDKETETEQCCRLDPLPKHTIDECPVTLCQTTQKSLEEDYPTYKTFPFSGCKHKMKPKPRCENSETRVQKSYEPDLRKLFSIPESSTKPQKRNEKNTKVKIKRKYSKANRRNNRIAHSRKKSVTTKNKNIKNDKQESSKKYLLVNILSRIKGRTKAEDSTSIDVDNITVTENAKENSEESEEVGCNCAKATAEETDTTEKAHKTFTNYGVIDEVFRKFIGVTGTEKLDKSTLTYQPVNSDESVTLIINVEDEVIAPPANQIQNLSKTNPLSVAVEEMLAEVKSKMTEAYGITTQPIQETESGTTTTGIITAERLKFINLHWGKTVDPALKHGLLCTHCYKLNYPELPKQYQKEGEVVDLKPVAETHLTPQSTEETTKEQESDFSELGISYTPDEMPVTDADYDQIISRIHCNFSEDTHPTFDILKNICQDRYGPITPNVRKHSLQLPRETLKRKAHTEIQTPLEAYSTQTIYQTEYQPTSRNSGAQAASSTNHHETTRNNDHGITNYEATTRQCLDRHHTTAEFSKRNHGSKTVQTICFLIDDFTESEITTKVTKTAIVTNYQHEDRETIHHKEDESTQKSKEYSTHLPLRLCNCTIPRSTHVHHHHYTLGHFFHNEDDTSSEEDNPTSNDHKPSHKVHPTTTVSFETNDEEEEENDIHITKKITTRKTKKTTTTSKPDDEQPKPKKQSKFKFYPPLSLYRTWLSPWAAVQIKPRPPPAKAFQPNNYMYNNYDHNYEQYIMSLSHQPYSVRPMSQTKMCTTDQSIKRLPSNLGKAKGVYMGAIIIGNKYLPPGFYKLEDLKKLKNSGISIPKIRGKKNIISDRVGYSLRRIYPGKASSIQKRHFNSRKIFHAKSFKKYV
ncbi:enolase-phosphatase E1 [Halyomorpha halys]|uniref:enolase-phosphatase E1 n=1 Tax=Halyomorpha halys TaxID=286706 RepID=UPI0006D511DE|nr:uncharacterized protein LOC106688887 [Halyomorpha halys]